jgi:ubiquinone/menaquinone biosynthesis C-methylase UbiE
MDQAVKDLFSHDAGNYAKYRPAYPPELFEFLLSLTKEKNFALDVGTGNGQAAFALSDYFEKVFATDISEGQISMAIQRANITYLISRAEELPFNENQFDLITCATAIHWFQFDTFFKEIKRVARPGAIFSCWAYSLVEISDPAVNAIIVDFYHGPIGKYWDPERKYIDEKYNTIPFPLEEIRSPSFNIKTNWSLKELEGYMNTWSAVQHFIKKNNSNPVTTLFEKIRAVFDERKSLQINFPIFMRTGRVIK